MGVFLRSQKGKLLSQAPATHAGLLPPMLDCACPSKPPGELCTPEGTKPGHVCRNPECVATRACLLHFPAKETSTEVKWTGRERGKRPSSVPNQVVAWCMGLDSVGIICLSVK